MAIRPRGQIRSHRALERRIVAPWIVTTGVTIVVVALISTGFYFLVREPCSGKVTATIIASPTTSGMLENIARSWTEGQPSVDGRCATVEIESQGSAEVIDLLGQRWNTKTGGTPPDVWVPDSSVWARRAAVNPVIARMLPEAQPSLARSVGVIAMPKPMAEAIGWPKNQFTWAAMINDVAGAQGGWAKFGKPEWGPFRLAMGDPNKSTAALLAITSLAGADDSGKPTDAGLALVTKLKQIRSVSTASTEEIITELSKSDRQGPDAVYGYLSAFPALEVDVLSYNQPNPTVPLVAIYPSDGSLDADNPYLVLRAEWADPVRQRIAADFLKFARSSEGRKTYQDLGFRDGSRAGGRGLTTGNGLTPKVATTARVAPPPATVGQVVTLWGS